MLDATLASKLRAIGQSVELCDPDGRVIGRFVPRINLAQGEPITPEASEDELDCRERANEKRYTTAEVLAHLEQR